MEGMRWLFAVPMVAVWLAVMFGIASGLDWIVARLPDWAVFIIGAGGIGFCWGFVAGERSLRKHLAAEFERLRALRGAGAGHESPDHLLGGRIIDHTPVPPPHQGRF